MLKVIATKASISISINGVLIYHSSVSSVVTESPAKFLPERKEKDNDVYVMQR